MKIGPFPFNTFNWDTIIKAEHPGDTGKAYWQVLQAGDIRIRMVEYSANYKANHWCSKGHVLHCIEGEMDTELEDGRIMKLTRGMTYIVGDNCEAHRSTTVNGCKLFIVD
jgi:hypothetical protein